MIINDAGLAFFTMGPSALICPLVTLQMSPGPTTCTTSQCQLAAEFCRSRLDVTLSKAHGALGMLCATLSVQHGKAGVALLITNS